MSIINNGISQIMEKINNDTEMVNWLSYFQEFNYRNL